MSRRPPPLPPGLRPVPGRASEGGSEPGAGDDVAAVLREFGGNRTALAAEVVRLRAALQDALFEVSRRAVETVRVVTPPSPPPSPLRTPPGF